MVNRNKNKKAGEYYRGYRHPKMLIGCVVWSYHRFMLSLLDVSEQLMMRGIVVSHQTIREWNLTFGQTYANEIKRRAPRRGDKWHMDEMCKVCLKFGMSLFSAQFRSLFIQLDGTRGLTPTP
jgi:transposase-like protein